jgi:hypothetical protein
MRQIDLSGNNQGADLKLPGPGRMVTFALVFDRNSKAWK